MFMIYEIYLKITGNFSCLATNSVYWRIKPLDEVFILLNLFQETWIHICIFIHISILIWYRSLKSFPMEDKDLFILHSQYHGCWWPGDARSQDISSHDIHLVFPEYSSFCVRRVNSALAAQEGLTFHIAWYLWCSKFIWSFQLYSRDALTHCPLGNLGVILKMQFSIIFYLSVSSDFLIMMPSDECYRPLLMISQHWFR